MAMRFFVNIAELCSKIFLIFTPLVLNLFYATTILRFGLVVVKNYVHKTIFFTSVFKKVA
jgi:hypothetical protein